MVSLLLFGLGGGGLQRALWEPLGAIQGLTFTLTVAFALVAVGYGLKATFERTSAATPLGRRPRDPRPPRRGTQGRRRHSTIAHGTRRLRMTPAIRELLAREFGRQALGALRIPAFVALFVAYFVVAPGRSGFHFAPLDPSWRPNDATMALLLGGLIFLAVGMLQFVSEELPRRRDLASWYVWRATGSLFTEKGGSGGWRWSRRVFSAGADSFVPVFRTSLWRLFVGLGAQLTDGRTTLDVTEHARYVLAARDENGELVFALLGYADMASATGGASTRERRRPSTTIASISGLLLQPVPLILGTAMAFALIAIARRFV